MRKEGPVPVGWGFTFTCQYQNGLSDCLMLAVEEQWEISEEQRSWGSLELMRV